ncbi:CHASE2 domain-containing protein [Paludibaculum fermentans]|uniref:CHASE2 domain-containing protein n=1 Tax=Paludibaculum fermentans TaxID=1473598 RepID=UPI003EBD678D
MRGIIAGALAVLCITGLFLLRPGPLVNLDHAVCDMLTRWAGPGRQSGRVVIVEIDDQSLTQFGRWPWPRRTLAQLTNHTFQAGAATVVFDMMFPEEDAGPPGPPSAAVGSGANTNDALFAAALSGRPSVIGYTLKFDAANAPSSCHLQPLPLVLLGPREAGKSPLFQSLDAICSLPQLSSAAAAAGYLNAAPDSDGKLRRIPLVMELGNRPYPALALAALNLYARSSTLGLATDGFGASELRLDNRAVPLEGQGLLRLRFRGPAGTLPRISAADVLANRAPEGLLRGRIAVIGGSALGLRNTSVTPVDALLPAVEIQATAIDNLLQGDSFRRPGEAQSFELALALFAGLAATCLLASLRLRWGALLTLALALAAWTGCGLLLRTNGNLISPLPVSSTLAGALAALTLVNYRLEKNRADLTQQRLASTTERSRDELRESESRYQQLVENINDAIILVNPDCRLSFANRRFLELFGLDSARLPDVRLEDHVAPDWRPQLREKYDRLFRGDSAHEQLEYEGIRPDGTLIWLEALITPVHSRDRIIGAQAALRDTTERKRIEAQYLQAQKMESVGRLAGSVAHDFNNLLTVINGYSEVLLHAMEDRDPSREGVEQIRGAGERATELTQKLLVFSRKQLAQLKVLDLNEEVITTRNMLGRLMGADILLTTRLSPQPVFVMADPTQLHQILMNLLVNARDSMPHGGEVVIETTTVEVDGELPGTQSPLAAGPYVCLAVTDTGLGMNDDVKQHLFEPFFTTKAPGKGTGLGLATIHTIVQKCGGGIAVTSQVGHGSSFQIYLPRVDSGLATQSGPRASATQARGSETVLVVDDQDPVRQLVCSILKAQGYRVLQAASGPAAVALAARYPETIHLLLTDVVMPQMSGRHLADTLATSRPGLKVLFMSGYSGDTVEDQGVALAGLEYLAKPFTIAALADKVHSALARDTAPDTSAPPTPQDPRR